MVLSVILVGFWWVSGGWDNSYLPLSIGGKLIAIAPLSLLSPWLDQPGVFTQYLHILGLGLGTNFPKSSSSSTYRLLDSPSPYSICAAPLLDHTRPLN